MGASARDPCLHPWHAILILAVAVFFNIKLPLITSQQQAFVIIIVLMGTKIVDSVSHSLLSRS